MEQFDHQQVEPRTGLDGSSGAQMALLPGGRLHLHHGPSDLICEALGDPQEVEESYRQAWERFQTLLAALVENLPLLRTPAHQLTGRPTDPTSRRMISAVSPYQNLYVTPMAAIAGAVADEVLAAMTANRKLERAYVNNGGDIAIHLKPGARFVAGVVSEVTRPEIRERVALMAGDGVGGMATSGWRGRSWSLGVADAVTVFARSAAQADAAATLIANAVNVNHPHVQRTSAREVFPDGDLEQLEVTTDVGELPQEAILMAINQGSRVAARFLELGHIKGALLYLQGQRRAVGHMAIMR